MAKIYVTSEYLPYILGDLTLRLKFAMDEMERNAQKTYWKEHSCQETQEEMMLDSRANEIDVIDRPEILAALGSVKDCRVVELGAGIGRFTRDLAEAATHVTACDFMEHLLEHNKRETADLSNVSYRAVDVTQMDCPPDSADVVFSNWLLMYLSDTEVEKFLEKALSWLKEGGVLFFRESCYRQSGDLQRQSNPTHYRDVLAYFSMLDEVHSKGQDGQYFKYKLVRCANMQSYVQLKRNFGQIYWKLIKVKKEPGSVEPRQFLDHVQYTRHGILRYEKLFGHGFVSSGGIETTQAVFNKLHLQPGHSVLDVGCGIGGASYELACQYDLTVLGMDVSLNMIAIALERAGLGEYDDTKGILVFELADCTKRSFESGSFDAIYSRDALLHIHDKPKLFKSFYSWLKPGGEVVITDYCRATGEASKDFAAYIKQRNYDLHTVEAYGQMLQDTGFTDVLAEDHTDTTFVPNLEKELQRAEKTKASFLESFTEGAYTETVNGWKAKIERGKAGEHRWGLFYARKP